MHDAGDLLVLADVQDAREIGAVHLVHNQVIVGICSQGVGQLPHSPLRDHARPNPAGPGGMCADTTRAPGPGNPGWIPYT